MSGAVKAILCAENAGEVMFPNDHAELQAGKGIVGDRYYSSQGTFSKDLADTPDFHVTLIEQEQIDKFNQKTGFFYSGTDFRRNIVTTGIDLNELEGKVFTIGTLRLKGVRLCEPCAHLANILGAELMEHMVHKAGLRACILDSGVISLADKLSQVSD
jgi:MOSC domain-containing protein YiiM